MALPRCSPRCHAPIVEEPVVKPERLSGWGNHPVIAGEKRKARALGDLVRFARRPEPVLPQGNCRSYGDACLFPSVVSTLSLDRLLSFDPETGVLRAEAGVTLEKIIRFSLPLGWFLPVTPGTKFTTLGGCIAADVHGKNHHRDGCLSNFVDELEIAIADGTVIRCSRNDHPELFRATFGGMGLTGFVYAAAVRLRKVSSSFLRTCTVRTGSLAETCRTLVDTQQECLYSVAWIDCLSRNPGRGLVSLGRHAEAAEVRGDPVVLHRPSRPGLPRPLPVVNRLTARLFNAAYYRRQWRRQADALTHYDPFFYPLDAVGNWNRAYGRRGFLQYQFAVPFAGGEAVLEEFITRLADGGHPVTLAVLKTFGEQGPGPLSFPLPGFTLALDLPVGDGGAVAALRGLTPLVTEAGGRVYLAKDAVLEPEQFRRMYPRLDEFQRVKQQYDPHGRLRSLQSDRLGLT